MKIIFDESFHSVYTSDPASAAGRMEAITMSLPTDVDFIAPEPATPDQLELAHTAGHIKDVQNEGLYEIASLAAGGAIQAARIGLDEPCFALIRPPGHHASTSTAWGFCFFNNMAVALLSLRAENLITTALVLDIDLHYGDGTENILGGQHWAQIHNPSKNYRTGYLEQVQEILADNKVDMIGISAGFDNHLEDWGGLLSTDDYFSIGKMARLASKENSCGCFAIFEGGYNHNVLGQNVAALINGMSV